VSGDPYVYPDSGGVLRNLLDIHNDADLGAFESGVTYQRLTESDSRWSQFVQVDDDSGNSPLSIASGEFP
jgi:hypothetical protein